jgi:hypothetical protein
MRIDLSGPAAKEFNALSDRYGMTQLSMMSRLVEWFARQDESLRSRVLDSQAKRNETTKAILGKMLK